MARFRVGRWAGALPFTAWAVFSSIFIPLGHAEAQRTPFVYERVGSGTDVNTTTTGGLLLMGGSTDVDPAIAWLKNRANGGDIVVIRAERIGGYNPYIFGETAGVQPNSVATIGFFRRWADDADDRQFVVDTLNNAEAIFIAGGDQSDYDRYWRGTEVEDILNQKAAAGVPIGGTSAGLAILGSSSFVARGGSITSDEALDNPYDSDVTLEHDFLQMPYLDGVITDSHFSERDRHGRLVTFLSRVIADGVENQATGVGIDEQTALLIDENGLASLVSNNNGNAYIFDATGPTTGVQPNTALDFGPVGVTRLSAGDTYDFATGQHTGGDLFSYTASNGDLITGPALLTGDLNGDGVVDGNDFGVFASFFGTPSGATPAQGDLNGDGAVDGNDFGLFAANFGSGAASVIAVPEPSIALLFSAALGASARRSRP